MQEILGREGAVGLVLFATIKYQGRDAPVMVFHEAIQNTEAFMDELTKLLAKHGVKIG
jgi:hypothetical protein